MAKAGIGMASGVGDVSAVVGGGQGGPVFIGDGSLLTMGDYSRSGPDLTITGPDGAVVVVKGYFLTDTPPDLAGPQGMVIAGSLAERLAGPRVPGGQMAQAGDQLAQVAPIGSVEKLDGVVTVERADGTVVQLQPGDAIYEGDIVVTGGDGKIGLVFLDGSEFSLGGNGRMVLDEMVYDPNSGEGSSGVSLLSGTFSFISGQIAKASPDGATVTTPIATIGIRGTSGTVRFGGEDIGATEQLQVVLIPDPGGTVGEIIVVSPSGQVTTLNVPFNGLNMVGGLVQTFTVSAQDFMQDYGQGIDYLRSNFGNTLPPANQGPGGNGGPSNGDNGPQEDQDSGLGDQEAPREVIRVVLNPGGHGIPERPDIVPEHDYERPPRPANPRDEREGGFYQEEDETAQEDDDEDNDVVDDETGQGKVVTGSPGGDVLHGSAGSDSIFGGAGGDTLVASLGNDILNGGDGADWVSYSAFSANLSINLTQGTVAKGVGTAARTARAVSSGETGSLGTDTLISIENIIGGSGNDTFIGDAGNNTFVGGAGSDTLSHVGQTASVSVNLTTGVATGAGIGTDRISGIENVIGGSGNDTFVGNSGDNTIIGGAGRDTVSYAAQTSSVSVNLTSGLATGTGIGRDTLWGIETVIGGSGNDAFVGDAGDNAFIGGAGNDTVSYAGQTAGVTVNAATGVITGAGIGTDTVSGIEYFIGGSGNDTFIAGAGGNVFVGGAGSDTVSYAGKTASVSVDLSIGYAGVSSDSISSSSVEPNYGSYDRLEGIENAIGGAGDDYFVGNASNNTFTGGAGSDTVSYANQTAGVTVNLSTGIATGSGIGTDRLIGIENVFGGAGNDVLTGNAGDNFIYAGAGNDTVYFSGGDDVLYGGEGTDRLVVTAGGDIDLSGVSQFEVVDLRGGSAAELCLTADDVMYITGNGEAPVLRLRGDGGDRVTLDGSWVKGAATVINGVQYDVYTTIGYGEKTVTVQLESGLANVNTAPTLVTLTSVYWENMDSDPGWQGLGATDGGGWAWGTSTGASDPGTAATGASWVGFNMSDYVETTDALAQPVILEGGEYAPDMGPVSVSTGAISINGAAYVQLDFMRWLGVESNEYDHASIEVTVDGVNWNTVWANGEEGIDDESWISVSYDLSQWAGGHDTMYLRWTMGPTDDSFQYGGWNIDDVRVLVGEQSASVPRLPDMPLKPLQAFHAGALVSDLLGNATDADGDNLGIAIVEAETDHGIWEFSLDGGETWQDMGTVSEGAATLLDGEARIRFTPTDPAFEGGDVAFAYRAWDGSDLHSSGTTGVAITATGGRTAYSDAVQTVPLPVSGPNTAPVVASGVSAYSMADQYGDMSIDVADLDGESDPRGEPGPEPGPEPNPEPDPDFPSQEGPGTSFISDEDGPYFAGGAEGYAIVGATGAGVWQYSLDGGETWCDLPAVSETDALVLIGDTDGQNIVRFVPTDPQTSPGSASLILKAWDGSDHVPNGSSGVDTTNSPMNAYSTETFTHVLTIGDVPDWIAGTAVFDGSTTQWDTGAVPSYLETAHIYSSIGDAVTFDSTANFTALGLSLHGTAKMVVAEGGSVVLDKAFQSDDGTSLTISGGTLAHAPAYNSSSWTIGGTLVWSAGTIQGGNSYDKITYSGDGGARLHDGTSGDITLKGANLVIAAGSVAEMHNTTVYSDMSQDGYGTWMSSYLSTSGTLSVAAGTDNVLSVNLTVGDRYDYGRVGELVINGSASSQTGLATLQVTNYGTVLFTSDEAGATGKLNTNTSTLYNRGGLIHASGADGSTYVLQGTIQHLAHDGDGSLTGLIQVDSGVTLVNAAEMTVDGGANFQVDGVFRNDATMLFYGTGTDVTGQGSFINGNSMQVSQDLAFDGVDLVNNGVITAFDGAVFDFDPGLDGQDVGTFTNAGGSIDSLQIGLETGRVIIKGHYAVEGEATGSEFHLGGTTAGSGFDQLAITGTMERSGTVSVNTINAWTPSDGMAFDIITYGAGEGRLHHVEGLDTWLDQGIGMGVTVGETAITVTAHAVTHDGTALGDTLTGTGGADVIDGDAGSDLIIANGGADLIFGGAGDDRIVVNGLDFNHIDGGEGTDTLVFDGSVDLSGLGGELFAGLERISLEGAGSDVLTLDSHIVQSMSRDTDDLMIIGGAGDSVVLEGIWNIIDATTVAGTSYTIWSDADSSARVLVQDGLGVDTTA